MKAYWNLLVRYLRSQWPWVVLLTILLFGSIGLHLDMSFHNAHTPGELIERIDGDVTALSNFFSQFVIQILGNLFLLVVVIVVLSVQV